MFSRPTDQAAARPFTRLVAAAGWCRRSRQGLSLIATRRDGGSLVPHPPFEPERPDRVQLHCSTALAPRRPWCDARLTGLISFCYPSLRIDLLGEVDQFDLSAQSEENENVILEDNSSDEFEELPMTSQDGTNPPRWLSIV